jgi:hypothetical protein
MRLWKLPDDGRNNRPKHVVVIKKYIISVVLCCSKHVIVIDQKTQRHDGTYIYTYLGTVKKTNPLSE